MSRILSGRRDLIAPAAAFPHRYPSLLQSVTHVTPHARYDILFAFPQSSFQLLSDGQLVDDRGVILRGPFLDELDRQWKREAVSAQRRDDLPFHGGWFLLLTYELAAQIEKKLALPCDVTLPVALAMRCPAAIIVDHLRDRTILVAESGEAALLDAMESDVASVFSIPALSPPVDVIEDEPAVFLDGVARIHEHLLAGDVFQVNLSRAWRARYKEAPAPIALYVSLRQANPAPFAGLLQQEGWAIVSSSPERLVEVRDGIAQTRPIAGTRPRSEGDDDSVRMSELSAHPKERAEHVMLIDLERNDLGRVCVAGSVEVNELMVVESYAHVHHIVSNVRGRLRDGVTPGQVIAATFPGGTITGCPKVRCMEIIAALEQTPRGAYTGAMGYLDRNGDLDLNILIRTFTLHGNEASFRAGAGIVADSIAFDELEETRAKARGLLRALAGEAL